MIAGDDHIEDGRPEDPIRQDTGKRDQIVTRVTDSHDQIRGLHQLPRLLQRSGVRPPFVAVQLREADDVPLLQGVDDAIGRFHAADRIVGTVRGLIVRRALKERESRAA